jgi:hypothetical protein
MAPSREGSVFQECCKQKAERGVGFLAPALVRLFSRPCGMSPIRRSTRSLRPRLHPPETARLLQSATPDCQPHRPVKSDEAPPTGFRPSSRHRQPASTERPGIPSPGLAFRPRRFSRPRRLAPPAVFAGLFHPAATSRVCPPGVCPSSRSRTGFHRPIHALVPLETPAFDQQTPPRLQGLAPRVECGVR